MPDDLPTIKDLVKPKNGKKIDDDSAQAKLAKTQKAIKIKNVENTVEKEAQSIGMPYIDLYAFPISPEALEVIDEKECIEMNLVCFYYDGNNMRLATTSPNPEIEDKIKELEKEYHIKSKVYLVTKRSMDYALEMYKNLPKIKKVKGVEIKEADLKKFEKEIESYHNLNEKINEVSTTDVVTLLLATAIKTGSSDVHIEAEEYGIVVRLRIDGVLQEAAIIEKDKWKKIISRMKVLSKVKINIDDVPQDGRYTITLTNDKIDVRSSFLPTAFGESVVMRLLRASSAGLPFEDLGLPNYASAKLEDEIKKPNGLILATGPTGSGKTTTLYAIINKLNQPGTKIVTLENPIEYQLEGINQSQVNEKKGYTFAKGLRSILRQDPDIVMVGEIRDLETAEIAVQASLTGHLVLSTLHTNDSAGVIPRLIEIGVKPFFIVPSVNAIVGQRLVRRLCEKCRVEHKLHDDEKERVNKILGIISPKSGVSVPSELPKIYKKGEGCVACSGTGYKGRIGIYEIFTMSDDIKELTSNNEPSFKILQQAIENGMITMLQDGVLKVLDGVTSLEEIYRVIGKFDYIDELYEIMISKTIGRGIKIKSNAIEKAEDLSRDLKKAGEFILTLESNKILENVISLAIKTKAGDVHVDPRDEGVNIRFRIDGILHDIVSLSKEHYLPLLSEIKILCGFPTNVKKPSYDGRFGISFSDKKMDCRVSIISGGYGETVVMRLLSGDMSLMKMEELGMRPYVITPIDNSIKKTKGIVITTGPTGSGKTTTLYALLNKLNTPDVKIITVEDPIEYRMDGVMQTQIDKEKGYTFAAAMKSLLRQNPNIMMIGEIRDEETAKIAIEASLTGHLVLSTIHANSAAGAVSRFYGLGVEKEQLASAVNVAIGQRLARRICPHCKVEDNLSQEVIGEVKNHLEKISKTSNINIPKEFKFYKGEGCAACSGLGYKGRVGLYEVAEMTPGLQKIIQSSGVIESEIEQEAINSGMITIMQDGILKALEGETSIDETFRVVK